MADPKEDVEKLMNEGVGFADQMLREHGEFHPYGSAMTPQGEIVSVAASDGTELPPSTDLIELLKGGLRQAVEERKYKATAIFYDVRVELPDGSGRSDAIAAALDHEDNYSVIVFFPYKLEASNLEYGGLFAAPGENDVFGE